MDSSLESWEGYLRNYEKKFVFTALKVGSALKVEASSEELKSFFINLYNQTFFSKDKDLSSCVEMIERMRKKGIDLKFIATKAFMLLISDFAIQCFHKESSLEPVRELVERIEETLNACTPKEEELEDVSKIVRKLISHRERHFDFSDVDPESEAQKEILRKFSELFKKGEKIELFNLYKGLHIKNQFPILRVGREGVLVEVNPTHLGILAIDRFTIVRHPYLGKPYLAEVRSIDPDTKRVRLWRFKEYEGKEERRTSVRVKPKDLIEVSVKSEGGVNLKGYILDISLEHVNLFIPYRDLPFREGDSLELSMDLEDCRSKTFAHVKTEASAFSIRDLKRGKSVVFSLRPKPGEEAKVAVYISCRQKEIVRELADYVKEYLS